LEDLLRAAAEIGPRWPGCPQTLDWVHEMLPSDWQAYENDWSMMNTYAGLREFGRFVVLTSSNRSNAAELASTGCPHTVRAGAMQAMAEKWADEETRMFLARRVVEDGHSSPRIVAIKCLAEKWPTESTCQLLQERAVRDKDEWVRRSALYWLAKRWR